MNQQRNMYGSTAACTVNVASTSSLPLQQQQQHSAGAIPTANPTMYYVSQLPTDAYAQQQIIQYGDSTFAPQENVYPSKEMYTVSFVCSICNVLYLVPN